MLPLTDPLWSTLSHAYGPAGDMPGLLERARWDDSPGHLRQSAWFELWSALCHQGSVYSASYAAAPHLADIAHNRRGTRSQFDPLFLIACIELGRLEGQGPEVEKALEPSYATALQKTQALIEEALFFPWSSDHRDGLEAGRAALGGDSVKARSILNADH